MFSKNRRFRGIFKTQAKQAPPQESRGNGGKQRIKRGDFSLWMNSFRRRRTRKEAAAPGNNTGGRGARAGRAALWPRCGARGSAAGGRPAEGPAVPCWRSGAAGGGGGSGRRGRARGGRARWHFKRLWGARPPPPASLPGSGHAPPAPGGGASRRLFNPLEVNGGVRERALPRGGERGGQKK